jgi:hypothetical protein
LIETNVVFAGVLSVTLTVCASLGPRLLAVMVKVTSVFGAVVGGAVFVTARSALVTTVELTVDELFPAVVSGVPVMLAVFEIVVPAAVDAGTLTVIANGVLAPAGMLVNVQVTVPDVAPGAGVVHENPEPEVGVKLANAVPAGTLSVSTTLVATLGPAFVTVIVYVIEAPAVTVAAPLFATEISAAGLMAVMAVALLLAGFVS